MERVLSARVGTVEVVLSTSDEVVWMVRTRWFDKAGAFMTSGSKTFTGELAWFDAAAFANGLLAEEWERLKDPAVEKPVLVP